MKKFWLSFCFIFIISGLFLAPSFFVLADEVVPPPAEIVVSTAEEFNTLNTKLAGNPNLTIKLGADINFSENTLIPIGTELVKFCGEFDGAGYSLNNVNFTVANTNANYGVFAFTNGATIKNLNVNANFIVSEDININLNMGAIVAVAQNTEISQCKATVKMFEKEDAAPSILASASVGSLVGLAEGSIIKNCYALCETSLNFNGTNLTKQYYGGLVGKMAGGEIKLSYVSPTAEIINTVNGVVAEKENIVIKNLNAQADVAVGGVVGFLEGTNAEILNTMFIGYIKDEQNILYGGLIGKINESESFMPKSSKLLYSKYFTINNSTTASLNFAIGNSASVAFVEHSSLERISVFPTSKNDFILEDSGFDNSLYYWDFDNTWKNSTIYNAKGIFMPDLQQFSNLSIYLDYLSYNKYYTLNFKNESADVTSKSFKIGDEVVIQAKFNNLDNENLELGTYENFFTFNEWRKVGDATFAENAGVELTFTCSNSTAGSYYATFLGKPVEVNISIVNENKEAGAFGSVTYLGEKKTENFSFQSRYADEGVVISFNAEETRGEYKFSHFEGIEFNSLNKNISFKLDNNRQNSPKIEFKDGKLVCNIFAVFSNNTSVLNLEITKNGGSVKMSGLEESITTNKESVLINNKEYTFTADANKGYKFVGWFVNNEKVSEESSYTISIQDVTNLEAKFEKADGEEGGINIWLIIGPIIGALVLAGIITLIVIKVKNRDKYSYKKNYKY